MTAVDVVDAASGALDVDRLADVLSHTDTMTELEVALKLADVGVLVVPTVPGDKAPMLTTRHIEGVDPKTGERFGPPCEACNAAGMSPALDHGATVNPDVIRRYWNVHPEAGVALKNHPQLVRGDGDFDDVAALKKARKTIGYGQPGGCPEPLEAATPGGTYRRRWIHTLPEGVPAPGGGTRLLGVSWYGASGYTVVKGGHPNGGVYPPFVGSITPLPDTIAFVLQRRPEATDGVTSATSADVDAFLGTHNSTNQLAALDRRRRIVAAAAVGDRHHTAVGQLACAFRESIAGWYPARVAHDAIRDALSDAGWDQARFDAEWADVTGWALGQVKHLDKLTATAQIANRAYNEKVDALDAGYPPEYIDSIVAESSRDLTDGELDAWMTDPTQPADDNISPLPEPVDFHALYARQNTAEWFVDDIWPAGRQLHIFAARKTGKSLLMLWIAACLAVGRDPFSGHPIPPVIVVYLDYEMTEDDLLERLEEMGFAADQLAGRLIYYLWPTLPAMDTDAGGRRLVELVGRDGGQAVIIDTFSRVVEGEENSADTYRAFFTFTGMRLKRRGIPMARLDHEGHEGGRSRGSSAKADDVDVVWRLARTDDGLQFIRQASRLSWVPERVQLRQADPLGYTRITGAWPAGTKQLAADLDRLGVPIDATRRATRTAMRDAAITAPNEVLSAAMRYRRTDLRIGFA